MHVAIRGQVFWQSGVAGAWSGQHGTSSAITAIDIAEATAFIGSLTGVVSEPTTSPTITRIGSKLRCNEFIFIRK